MYSATDVLKETWRFILQNSNCIVLNFILRLQKDYTTKYATDYCRTGIFFRCPIVPWYYEWGMYSYDTEPLYKNRQMYSKQRRYQYSTSNTRCCTVIFRVRMVPSSSEKWALNFLKKRWIHINSDFSTL